MAARIARIDAAQRTRFGGAGARGARRGTIGAGGRRLEIGLVNNMPDAALAATERQFCDLLAAAGEQMEVRLHLYALRQVPRAAQTLASMKGTYRDAAALGSAGGLDGLIVTGAEPMTPDLAQEPYWEGLTGLIDWAEANTSSTILSCLAAHAGVRHLDAIAREPLAAKCSGVFSFETTGTHRLALGLEGGVLTPHSRRNGLSRRDLIGRGYEIVTERAEVGVDIFVKQRRSLFVFLQGHPEYEEDSLAREYRRDMGRFLRGEQARPPAIPAGYFSAEVEAALAAFARRAEADRRPELMADFPQAGASGPVGWPWRASAIRLYRNWLELLAERKAALAEDSPVAVRLGG